MFIPEQICTTLRSHPLFGAYIDSRFDTTLNTCSMDDSKVTDHHALIITEDPATGLSKDEQLIYDMDAATFHKGIEVYASQITAELLSANIERTDNRNTCPCPKCKSGNVVIYQKVRPRPVYDQLLVRRGLCVPALITLTKNGF